MDIGLGPLFFVVLFPVFCAGGSYLASQVVYGTFPPSLSPEVFRRTLPLWGVLYSRLLWWIIQSFTEELTYQGYALPRLQLLTGRSWIAISWVSFGWALQHCFVPFVPYFLGHPLVPERRAQRFHLAQSLWQVQHRLLARPSLTNSRPAGGQE